jgi:hypothetical protein
MSVWKKIQKRAGWQNMTHSSKVSAIWAALSIAAYIALSLSSIENLKWHVAVVIVIGLRSIAKFVVGPEKKEKEGGNSDTEHIQRD